MELISCISLSSIAEINTGKEFILGWRFSLTPLNLSADLEGQFFSARGGKLAIYVMDRV